MQTMQQVSVHLRCCTWIRIRDLERTQISHSRDDEALQRGDVRAHPLFQAATAAKTNGHYYCSTRSNSIRQF
jgi:hypothetical protein